MSQAITPSPHSPGSGSDTSPFDAIRHTDAFGREYWLGREMQPLMGYPRWADFLPAIRRAMAAAKNTGHDVTKIFRESPENPSGLAGRPRIDYQLTRHAAYLLALNGDPNKVEVAAAQTYFATKTREAELGALTAAEIRQTALARAREMVDYKIFRDMMAENAPDYEPSSRAAKIFFGAMQNRLYRHLTGMNADQIKEAREICHWKGRETGKLEPTKKDRETAKNYLTVGELNKLNRLVGLLCLRAEVIAEDGLHLSLAAWEELVDAELAVAPRQIAA